MPPCAPDIRHRCHNSVTVSPHLSKIYSCDCRGIDGAAGALVDWGVWFFVYGTGLCLAGASAGAKRGRRFRANRQVVQIYQQGKYSEALALAEKAVALAERVLGKEHPDTLTSVNNLAVALSSPGPLRRGRAALPPRAGGLRARARQGASRHADKREQSRRALRRPGPLREAEPLYRRALEARERVLGKEHPDTLISVNNLAGLYQAQGRYGEAEPLYRRALEA